MTPRALLTICGLAGSLLLCSVPGSARRLPLPAQQPAPSQSSSPQTDGQHKPGDDSPMPGMPGMDMGQANKDTGNQTETGAMRSMQHGHMNGPHMHMTPMRPATPEDLKRADDIAAALRPAIERYRDYRVALADGYRIFAPNMPQAEYHFTNYYNGFLEGFTFDPARPTSLLYKKTHTGYELIGAMYTAPKNATLDQLNERVPLGVASWHAHINLCIPKRGEVKNVDWTKFGLTGSIATAQACTAAGGRFFPQVFGWMVHVYPFESTRAAVWGQ